MSIPVVCSRVILQSLSKELQTAFEKRSQQNLFTFQIIGSNYTKVLHIYVNHDGKVEKFDPKKAKGGEDEQTWKRIKMFIEMHFPFYTSQQNLPKSFFDSFIQMYSIDLKEKPNFGHILLLNAYISYLGNKI